MPNPKINFLKPFEKEPKQKKNLSLKILFYPLIFFGILILIFSIQVILSGESIADNLEKINIFNNFGFTASKDKLLKGESDDRINFLLLGMGGEGHPGPYLTDTMIIASLKPSENKISLISIPRDLSVPIPNYGWRKINNANHFGEMQAKSSGPKFTADLISKVFEIPIHYYVRLDFSGFENLIDELGGIKINVENGFVDSSFPTDDYGYQTVSFKPGWQKMNGQTALIYARSRHGTNNENSDFARSKRQQQVLQAIKDEAFSFTTFLSYRKISALLKLYQEHVVTNLDIWEIYKLIKLAKKINSDNISHLVLENGPTGPLYATNINGAYLLLPRDMSFYQLQQMIKNVFEPNAQLKPQEKTKVEIQNGTKIEGLAYQTSLALKNIGFQVIKIANAAQQNYEKTVIYDLTNNQKPEALAELKNKFNANVSADKPSAIITYSSNTDFLIILGQDQEGLSKAE
jgi:LCP family protein required for cell wall assembly